MDKKVVFITGASRGIGVATARKFADGGWRVAGFYRNSAGPEIENVKYYQNENNTGSNPCIKPVH